MSRSHGGGHVHLNGCVGGDGGESNSPSRKFHWSASTCVAAGLLYLVRALPAAHCLAPGCRIFFDDAPCGFTVAPQVFGACAVCLRCTPTDVAGQLCRSEGDFSFASCVVARFIVGRRHGTQPRATLPVEPTRPHALINLTTNMTSCADLRESDLRTYRMHRLSTPTAGRSRTIASSPRRN